MCPPLGLPGTTVVTCGHCHVVTPKQGLLSLFFFFAKPAFRDPLVCERPPQVLTVPG